MSFMEFLPLVSSALGYLGQDETNEQNYDLTMSGRSFNSAEALANREFQREMSNTSYQRAVKDMMASGLNPMLAYSQGGASTPSGSAGSAPASIPMGNKATAAAQGAAATAQIQNTAAQTRNLDADTANKEAELAGKQHSGPLAAAQVDNLRKQTLLLIANAELSWRQEQKVKEEIDQVLAATANLDAQTALAKVNAILARHDIARMSAEEAYFKTPVGRTSPHNKYGPQTPFRFIEGLAERFFNAKQFDEPRTAPGQHSSGRIRGANE